MKLASTTNLKYLIKSTGCRIELIKINGKPIDLKKEPAKDDVYEFRYLNKDKPNFQTNAENILRAVITFQVWEIIE